MVKVLADFFTGLVRKYLPDAFLFAVILTFTVFLLGMIIEGKTALEMVSYWGDKYWSLLAFAMQMVLVLSTGHTLAKTSLIGNILTSISRLAKTPAHAIVIVTLVASTACWINWGFGLIVGALMARKMAEKVQGVHYPLMVASAYSGYMIWHAGISGTIPLTIAQKPVGIMAELSGGKIIPISETVFATQTLIIFGVLFVTLPIINYLMMPTKEDRIIEIDPALLKEDEISINSSQEKSSENPEKEMTFAEKIENSSFITMLTGLLGLSYLGHYFYNGGTIQLDIVNFIFLFAGIILHRTPAAFLRAFNDSIKSTGGIVLQFPLYAGIMGMITQSGLAVTISELFVRMSTPNTFPFFTFLSAGFVNFFVPSGGGHWVVQSPIIMPAAKTLGVPLWKAAMAIAWGDAWTNMIQPFWTVPLLAIAGLTIRDIMGYCTVTLLWGGLIISLGMLFL